MKMTSISRANLLTLGDKYGVDIAYGGGQYGPAEGVVKLRVSVRETAAGVSGAEATFARYCHFSGLQPSDFGREFTSNGERYRICGYKPSAPKFPILATHVSSGRTFKFTDSVAMKLKAVPRAA